MLFVDDTNNRVGIGTASPAVALDVVGAISASGAGGNIPHDCVRRNTSFDGGSGSVSCLAGEIATGCAGDCGGSRKLKGITPANDLSSCSVRCTSSSGTAFAICCKV